MLVYALQIDKERFQVFTVRNLVHSNVRIVTFGALTQTC